MLVIVDGNEAVSPVKVVSPFGWHFFTADYAEFRILELKRFGFLVSLVDSALSNINSDKLGIRKMTSCKTDTLLWKSKEGGRI